MSIETFIDKYKIPKCTGKSTAKNGTTINTL